MNTDERSADESRPQRCEPRPEGVLHDLVGGGDISFRVDSNCGCLPQGAIPAVATLGYHRLPLRGTEPLLDGLLANH